MLSFENNCTKLNFKNKNKSYAQCILQKTIYSKNVGAILLLVMPSTSNLVANKISMAKKTKKTTKKAKKGGKKSKR